MKVLMTGGNGFIGAHCRKRFIEAGWDVQLLGRVNVDAQSAEQQTLPLPGGVAPDVVVHLAAVLPAKTAGGNVDAAKRNRLLDRIVFRAARDWGADLIYASGTSVYDAGDSAVKTEKSPVASSNPYIRQKAESESLGADLFEGRPQRFTSLRISAPYGPGQTVKTVLHTFVDRAIANEPLEYFGSGVREQDFTHVSDVVAAFEAACVTDVSGVINIASGQPVTMKELARTVVAALGSCSRIVGSSRADPQEGATARFSILKAQEVLDWSPRISLEDGVKSLAGEFSR